MKQENQTKAAYFFERIPYLSSEVEMVPYLLGPYGSFYLVELKSTH
jgi:hypothetical protein